MPRPAFAAQTEVGRVPVASGRVLARSLAGDPDQDYFLYVPDLVTRGSRILVAVHGASRNALAQARQFASMGERYGVVVVAPLFPADRFTDYQRLGQRGARADQVLQAILAEVREEVGLVTQKAHLFGYSDGGQFAHRYAMAHPATVAGVVVASVGWFTFPDAGLRYPYGTAAVDQLNGLEFSAPAFLRVPMSVFVGHSDLRRDIPAQYWRRIEVLNGSSRLERARAWVQAMATAAAGQKMSASFQLKVLPRLGGSFVASVKWAGLAERVCEELFGVPTDVYRILDRQTCAEVFLT